MTVHNSLVTTTLKQADRVIRYLRQQDKGVIKTKIREDTCIRIKTLEPILVFLLKQRIILRYRYKSKTPKYFYNPKYRNL